MFDNFFVIQIFLAKKNLGFITVLGHRKNWTQNFLVQNFGAKKNIDKKKVLSLKNFGQTNSGAENFFCSSRKTLGSRKKF